MSRNLQQHSPNNFNTAKIIQKLSNNLKEKTACLFQEM
jgi:hypothetical protein